MSPTISVVKFISPIPELKYGSRVELRDRNDKTMKQKVKTAACFLMYPLKKYIEVTARNYEIMFRGAYNIPYWM